jgi:hypothetical protein
MSYQMRPSGVQVVMCDLCGDFSGIGNRDWREMPHRVSDQPTHLCRACRHQGVWCSVHQTYHRPDAFHRHKCVDCGGLFTSVVREQQTRCPSCRRSGGKRTPLPVPQQAEQPRSWSRFFVALRPSHRR